MRQTGEPLNIAKLRRPPQVNRRIPGTEVADAGLQRACQMLKAERVRVARYLECGAFAFPSGAGARGHAASAENVLEFIQNRRQICVYTRERRVRQRTREIAILAMRRAASRNVELPDGAGRNRLRRPLTLFGAVTTAIVLLAAAYADGKEARAGITTRFDLSWMTSPPSRAARSTIARPCSQRNASGVTSTCLGSQACRRAPRG